MPDSGWFAVFVGWLLAWAWAGNRKERREREMKKQIEQLEDEDEPVVREAAPAGRRFERRFYEPDAEWEPIGEEHALRVLACSFLDVPLVLEAMQKGDSFRTPFAEYRLIP